MSSPRMVPTPVPFPSAPPQSDRLRRRLRRLVEPFWVVPALWSFGAVVAGLGLPEVDRALPLGGRWLFEGSSESARVVLSTTAGAMISVTGLVFSITIVVLQLASSQFSPRVLKTFLDDRITQHTLGVFAASFLYALTVLRSLTDSGAAPQIAVTVSFLVVLGAIAMFLAFIHHITQSITVSTVISRTGDRSRALLKRSEERAENLPSRRPHLPHHDDQRVLSAWASGYLNYLDTRALASVAREYDAHLEILHPLGTFVPEGAPLAMVFGAQVSEPEWEGLIAPHLTLAGDRTMEQDFTYGLRRLVDIAERALSPGVNDPTTAVQVLDEIHDLLRRMVVLDCVYGAHVDDEDTVRVTTSEWDLERYLSLALDEIAHWGDSSLQIPARLERMLVDLESAAVEVHKSAIRAKAHQLRSPEGRHA